MLGDHAHQSGFTHAGTSKDTDILALTDGERGITGDNLASLLQGSDDLHDALLGILHILHANIGGNLQVIPDALGYTDEHVGKQLVRYLSVGRSQCQYQVSQVAVPDEALHGAVVHGDDILEHEYQLADLVGQLGVVFGQSVEDGLLAGLA